MTCTGSLALQVSYNMHAWKSCRHVAAMRSRSHCHLHCYKALFDHCITIYRWARHPEWQVCFDFTRKRCLWQPRMHRYAHGQAVQACKHFCDLGLRRWVAVQAWLDEGPQLQLSAHVCVLPAVLSWQLPR